MSKFSELYGPAGGRQQGDNQRAGAPATHGLSAGSEAGQDSATYAGYDSNRNGRPTMGFYIAHVDGTLDGFMYHDVRHPKFQVRDDEEFLTFVSSGIAVTMSGTGLRQIFDALMRHTLKAIYEYDGRLPVRDGAPVVTALSVKQAVPARAEQPLELVRPAKKAV